jgi:hypothetical protein
MDFVPPKDGIFLSTMPVGPGQRRLALAVVAVATVLFLASALNGWTLSYRSTKPPSSPLT